MILYLIFLTWSCSDDEVVMADGVGDVMVADDGERWQRGLGEA